MGKNFKESVQTVVSHLEGTAGNFLARLYADYNLDQQEAFKTDCDDRHPRVLSTGPIDSLIKRLDRIYNNHDILVTHCQDLELLKNLFPNARIIQIYPYTNIGNVLYNICIKKLTVTTDNPLDSYFIQISDWYTILTQQKPNYSCVDYSSLRNSEFVQKLLGINFSITQQNFFSRYWQQQLPYDLDIPMQPTALEELITIWNIDNFFNDWAAAWAIFVYEKINGLSETQRLWSIDQNFNCWQDVYSIQQSYAK